MCGLVEFPYEAIADMAEQREVTAVYSLAETREEAVHAVEVAVPVGAAMLVAVVHVNRLSEPFIVLQLIEGKVI